ncbi:transcription factor IIA subunit alpha [Phlyctochytrium planicorne]|nr:transcription factor IIA subunit alpha [Phlyctochytrium planicorne]
MSNTTVPSVYSWIISDVISKSAGYFAEMGTHEQVLRDLEKMWDEKIRASQVATFPASLLNGAENTDPGTASAASVAAAALTTASAGQPLNFAGLGTLDPALVAAARYQMFKGNGIPQTDGDASSVLEGVASSSSSASVSALTGAGKVGEEGSVGLSTKEIDEKLIRELELAAERRQGALKRKTLHQVDGHDDDDDEEDEDEEDGIDSDLDDDESDEEEKEYDHIILCQYEKVSRIKNKWKCVLRDGIINVNGKDYLFNKANGDFEW